MIHDLPTPRQFKQWTDIQVRWGEIDGYRHVNNVAYFAYFEAARGNYFDALNIPEMYTGEAGLQIMVNCSMNFRKEVHFPARLRVGVRVAHIRNTSYEMQCGMFLGDTDTLAADGTAVIVFVDATSKKPMRVPDNFKHAITRLEQ